VVKDGVAALKQPPCCVLEIAYEPEIAAAEMSAKAAKSFVMLES